MPADRELRGFLARLLGWRTEHAVDQALASIELASAHRAHLVLCGAGDLVPIAHALHRRTLGPERPFIVCDPHRGNTPASVRSPANRESAAEAIAAATGGTLCVRRTRLPQDFASITTKIWASQDIQYIVCANEDDDHDPLLVVSGVDLLP